VSENELREALEENRDVLNVAYFEMRIITIRKYNPYIFHAMKNGLSQKMTAFLQKF